MSRVSILLTYYNNPMVFDAIASVEAQTYKDWELILLNDNGLAFNHPDATWKYYKSNVRDEDRWKTARYAEQINVGLKLAEGDLIAYLADDDTWKENKLERVVSFFDQHPEAFAVCSWQELRNIDDPNGKTGYRTYNGVSVLGDPYCVVDHSNVVHRRECYEKVGGWPTDNLRLADAEYWRKLYNAGYRFHVIQEMLDVHRFHKNSWSSRMDRGEHVVT